MKKLFSKLMFVALTAMTFTACSDVPNPYDVPGTGQNVPGVAEIPGGEGEGTFAVPFNTVAAINFGNKLGAGEVSKNYMYIKGKVSKIEEPYTTQYGNGTFYISDDGSHGNEFYVYRALYLGNAKFATGDEALKLGDEVIICAKITNYNGTIETNQKEGFIYELNGVNRGGEILPDPEKPSGDGTLPYTSSNLADWSLFAVTADQPWSQGKDYTQATGYQKWSGADIKSNRAVEGWLISPVFNTAGSSEVKISFDHTIKYTNKVSGWEANHKIYASNNYDGTNVNAATWMEVAFTPVASPYPSSDWTLYTSGELQLPAEMANQEKVYVAFWFKAPAEASTTWELKNFKIESGKAGEKQDPEPTPDPTTDTKGTKGSPFTVTDAITTGSGTGVYVKGYIVGYIDGMSLEEGARFSGTSVTSATNLLLAASADETAVANCMPIQLPTGAIRTALNLQDNPSNYKQEVTLYGNIEKYFKVPGLKGVTYAILNSTEIGTNPDGGSDPTPDPTGVQVVTIAEFNAAAESTSVWYQLTGTISNLKAGDLYGNFDLTDASGSVFVYGVLSEKGGAKKLFQDLVSQYGIANGTTITIIGNRGSYNGKIEVTNAYFVSVSK